MSKGVEFPKLKGDKLKIAIAVTRWNEHIMSSLLDGCKKALQDAGVKAKNITVVEVPGSYELPFAAKHLMQSKKKYDAVVALGCLIKGETMHFEYIADAVAHGLMSLNVDDDISIPVVFGVLCCLTEKQAIARSTGKNNHGYGWGQTAVEMALLRKLKV